MPSSREWSASTTVVPSTMEHYASVKKNRAAAYAQI